MIKGPLKGTATLAVIEWYLQRETLLTGVVYSHNTECVSRGTLHGLRSLMSAYPGRFLYSLVPPPPSLGLGYRNSQREACYHGIKAAIDRWGVQFVVVHRNDAGFVSHRLDGKPIMPRLASIMRGQPRPTTQRRGGADVTPPGHRLGFGPAQIDLGVGYGAYHLDDHVLYGHAADVLAFYDVHSLDYCRSCSHSTSLLPEVAASRRSCLVPGPESENGQLWVKTLGRLSGGLWTPPRETVELLRQRAFVLNTAVLGYVWLSSSDADDPQLLSAFPLNASRVSVIAIESFLFSKFFRRNANAGNRFALLTACHQIEWERGSAVATFDVFDLTTTPCARRDYWARSVAEAKHGKYWECPPPEAPQLITKYKKHWASCANLSKAST